MIKRIKKELLNRIRALFRGFSFIIVNVDSEKSQKTHGKIGAQDDSLAKAEALLF